MSPDAPDDSGHAPATGASAEKDGAADLIVKKHMLVALAVGLVPLPIIDLAPLTVIQLRMLSRLSHEYDVEFSEQLGRSLIGSLLGAGASSLATSSVTRLLLQFALGGWLVGAVSTSVFASASTYAVGKVFIQHFASGGTFLTFDPDEVRDYYEQLLAQGGDASGEVVPGAAGIKP